MSGGPGCRSRRRLGWLSLFVIATVLCFLQGAEAYKVPISDSDELRQTCSGMWAGKDTSIELSFKPNSTGTVATIFYEWQDFPHLGKAGPDRDIFGDALKTYICTPAAEREGLCTASEVGEFIIEGNGTTIQRQRVDFASTGSTNDTIVTYKVNSTGYYCVGASAVPLTSSNVHGAFQALVIFNNAFEGQLPGGEFPKLGFYFGLTCLYIILGLVWAYLCVKHRDELLTIQHFISGLFVLLIIEQLTTWAYYSYLNKHAIDFWRLASINGNGSETYAARSLLVFESLLDSGRNSASFFLMLIVAMGYGVVRPSLDPRIMIRVKALTAVHLICGCLYSVGIVLLTIEAGGTWVFLFIFPLAFTLTGFMMWTLTSLKATMEYLQSRKQTFKLSFFRKLHRILLGSVAVIFAFFVVSSIAFSQSGGENFPSQTWRWRWFLLDGWTSILYLTVFSSVAWIWRPTGQNLRLSMSDEVATGDDPDGNDMEMGGEFAGPAHAGEDSDDEDEAAKRRKRTQQAATAAPGEQAAGTSSAAPPAYEGLSSGRKSADESGEVMFSLGEDDDEEGAARRASTPPPSRTREQEGLLSKRSD